MPPSLSMINSLFTRYSLLKPLLMLVVVCCVLRLTNKIHSQDSLASDDPLLTQAQATFDAISGPTPEQLDRPIVRLGQQLFWDRRLSLSGNIACASCHAATSWGADAERFSLDAKQKTTKRNSQTVFNALLQPGLRWTADRRSGAHQAERSLTGSMGLAAATDIVPLLEQHGYAESFSRAFPDSESPLSPGNYATAIEAYEQTLLTPAPWDRYLFGQENALTPQQQTGLRLFLEIGCGDCHHGKVLGGEGLEKFGVHADYWTLTQSETRDRGLFETSQQQTDQDRFRIAPLRNIEKTAPYFHDGSVQELGDAIRIMAKLQLNQELTPDQLEAIAAFLQTLTGQIPENYFDPHRFDQR